MEKPSSERGSDLTKVTKKVAEPGFDPGHLASQPQLLTTGTNASYIAGRRVNWYGHSLEAGHLAVS